MMRKAVFLDRDGTLIEEVDHLSSVEETRLFPFTIEALDLLRTAGFEFHVVTNQSGVARGYFDEYAVNAIHGKISSELAREGLAIESFQFCPHMPDAGCACRKPASGMIEDAVAGRDIDLSSSWTIGDKELDVGLGKKAGTKTVLVKTGYGSSTEAEMKLEADIVAEDLLDAAKRIVEFERKG